MPSKTLKTKNSALFSHHYHHTIHMLKFTHNISRIPLQYHLYRNKKIKINPHHKSLIHVEPKISQVHKLEREKKERKKERERSKPKTAPTRRICTFYKKSLSFSYQLSVNQPQLKISTLLTLPTTGRSSSSNRHVHRKLRQPSPNPNP